MLITCPTCASSYRIDAAKIGPQGKSVRCAACRETWFITADAAAEEPEPSFEAEEDAAADPVSAAAWAEAAAVVREAAEPDAAAPDATAPVRRRNSAPRARPKRPSLAVGAFPPSAPAIALLAVLAALPVLCLARNTVVGLVPRTASVFSAIGLPVNRRGLEIRDVVAFQNPAADDRPGELTVEGDLVGVGRTDVPVPALRIEISDAAGKPLRAFPAPAPRTVLGTGESARFHAKLTDPPAEGRSVHLSFADAGAAEGHPEGH